MPATVPARVPAQMPAHWASAGEECGEEAGGDHSCPRSCWGGDGVRAFINLSVLSEGPPPASSAGLGFWNKKDNSELGRGKTRQGRGGREARAGRGAWAMS